MSAALLYDSIARIARHEAGARAVAAVGEVTSAFAAEGAVRDHAVTVRLRESGLVLPRVPIAVGALGFAAIPAVGDLVMVVFAEGDLHSPVVVGRLYRSDVDPPKHGAGQLVLRLPVGSADPALSCEIAGDPPSIKVTLPGDVSVELTKGKVRCQAGDVSTTMDGGGRLEVKVGDASMTFKKDGDVSLKCKQLKVDASSEIQMSAAGTVKIKGATVEIN